MKNAVSLKDVADSTGVSVMTVSRVVNGDKRVREATRLLVLDAVRRMGYSKDVFASINADKRKGIRRRKHVLINFPMAYFSEKEFFNFFSLINIKIISELQASRIDYSLVHIDGDDLSGNIDEITRSDVVIHCGRRSAASLDAVRKLNRDASHVCICFQADKASSVQPDDVAGGQLAAEHFHRKGHRHVLCFTYGEDESLAGRAMAFASQMNRFNPDSQADVIYYPQSRGNDETAMKRALLDDYFAGKCPSGIFVPNGYDTMIIYKYLRDRNIRIPDDISLLGYDELEFYDFIETPLSRIAFVPDAIGKATVAMITDILDERYYDEVKTVIPVRLTDKGSVKDLKNQ